MVVIDDYGDLVDESNPSGPPYIWVFWALIIIITLDGCMRRGV